MKVTFSGIRNYQKTKKLVGYIERNKASINTYQKIGFKSGLEIHQQLKTQKKLFCRCPARIYQKENQYDSTLIRHMRPTLSELGEYDGTALMEFKTKKNIIYRIKHETACTYDYDDTPPFPLNREALNIAIEIALLLKTNIVGEIHITRKQYLDGSIPTGFQRTAIIGIDGEIQLKNKKVRILQLSLEEDACREVSDYGHWRIYTTDRLGIPLVETVTYPDLKTPDEVAEAAQYIRFLTRSTGKVRTGIGAAREDVNVSVEGGTRVEIKGVAHIIWIPELVHNEAFRQVALLKIKNILNERVKNYKNWHLSYKKINYHHLQSKIETLKFALDNKYSLVAINLPHFKGILSFFTQPGKTFANELSERVKVIACIELPNMYHSEELNPVLHPDDIIFIRNLFNAENDDAQILLWGPEQDIPTAIETIEERCKLAFERVPNETRKAFENGVTIFERVLPGPDRMYPDTDSAPIAISDSILEQIKKNLPIEIHQRFKQLNEWNIPPDTHYYLLRMNLLPLIEKIIKDFDENPIFVATLFAHKLKHIEGKYPKNPNFQYDKIYDLFKFINEKKLAKDIILKMITEIYHHPNIDFESILNIIEFKRITKPEIINNIKILKKKYKEVGTSKEPEAKIRWIMGHIKKIAIGNVPLKELKLYIEKEINNEQSVQRL